MRNGTITMEASRNAFDAFCSPSAAITLPREKMIIQRHIIITITIISMGAQACLNALLALCSPSAAITFDLNIITIVYH